MIKQVITIMYYVCYEQWRVESSGYIMQKSHLRLEGQGYPPWGKNI